MCTSRYTYVYVPFATCVPSGYHFRVPGVQNLHPFGYNTYPSCTQSVPLETHLHFVPFWWTVCTNSDRIHGTPYPALIQYVTPDGSKKWKCTEFRWLVWMEHFFRKSMEYNKYCITVYQQIGWGIKNEVEQDYTDTQLGLIGMMAWQTMIWIDGWIDWCADRQRRYQRSDSKSPRLENAVSLTYDEVQMCACRKYVHGIRYRYGCHVCRRQSPWLCRG